MDSFGFGDKECAVYGDHFFFVLYGHLFGRDCGLLFWHFFQMLQLFLSMHEQLCGMWG